MTSPLAEQLSFDADSHTYWHGMARVPSVSEIMRPLTEHYLRAIPENVLTWKRDLGIAVHRACELYDLGNLDEEVLDPRILPYLEGYKKFAVDYPSTWTGIEARVFHATEWYAGTLDRIGLIRGIPVIVDIKTSHQVASYAGIQLWAYASAVGAEGASLYVLQLTPAGTYELVPFVDIRRYAETWAGLLAVHRWTEEYSK